MPAYFASAGHENDVRRLNKISLFRIGHLKQLVAAACLKASAWRPVYMLADQDTKAGSCATGEVPGVQRRLDILLIEDNPDDARITVEAFRDAKAAVKVHTVQSGVDALRFLRRAPPYADSPPPNLVLLDLNLNMSGVNGYDVLTAMKADDRLKSIPVLVLSGSENPAGIDLAYALQASVYLVKPADLEDYFTMVRAVKDIWLRFASLPRVSGHRSVDVAGTA